MRLFFYGSLWPATFISAGRIKGCHSCVFASDTPMLTASTQPAVPGSLLLRPQHWDWGDQPGREVRHEGEGGVGEDLTNTWAEMVNNSIVLTYTSLPPAITCLTPVRQLHPMVLQTLPAADQSGQHSLNHQHHHHRHHHHHHHHHHQPPPRHSHHLYTVLVQHWLLNLLWYLYWPQISCLFTLENNKYFIQLIAWQYCILYCVITIFSQG